MNPSKSSKNWGSVALGMSKMGNNPVALMALRHVCPGSPWQSHKLHLRTKKSIESSGVILTNARRSYCASVKEEERNHLRVTWLEREEGLNTVPFRLIVRGDLVRGKDGTDKRSFILCM